MIFTDSIINYRHQLRQRDMLISKDSPWFSFRVSEEQRQLQRDDCMRFAAVAHCSGLVLVLAFVLFAFLEYLCFCNTPHSVDSSRRAEKEKRHRKVSWLRYGIDGLSGFFASCWWQRLRRWLTAEMYADAVGLYMGRRDEWIFTAVWCTWLFMLCVLGQDSGMCLHHFVMATQAG